MKAFAGNEIIEVHELNEYRMSNKEFRMTKFDYSDAYLRRSSFVIRCSAVHFLASSQTAGNSHNKFAIYAFRRCVLL